jgi:hypothetical protein
VAVAAGALFDKLVALLRPGISEAQLARFAALQPVGTAEPAPILELRLEGAPDVETRTVFGDRSGAVTQGQVLHLAVQAWAPDGSLLAAVGDTFLVGAETTVPLAHVPRSGA